MKSASPEQSLFAEALRRATPEARAAYLDSACGEDIRLRRRVEDLIRAAENAGDFLENPPTGLGGGAKSGLLASELSENPGDRIGRYKLLEKIGEGGCGVVYMAEQEEPVRRRVALKIIKLGMDTRSVVARFEAERQALALLDHPNIAKVLDGGATQTGRLYLVMELVRGVPITRFCEETKLSTEARLRLFVQVCQAVQHAHQKGLIHRDLKPSNILVTVNDGVPVPKVIDFGIAKAIGQRLTEKTLFTQFHAFIGTPAYISPEQAEMSSVDVDTRSDIYSLGVLLYQLLTGRTPFNGEELLRSGLDEMRRMIREEQPPKPSTRLAESLHTRRRASPADPGNSGEQGTSSRRRTQDEKAVRLVRGDLDCIVMKCLEKDRARRYETANGLATDIQLHLRHEPIRARPSSAFDRAGRWCRRHPAVAALSAGVLLLTVLLAIASTIAAWRIASAHRSEHEQRTRAEVANRELQRANTHLADTVNLLEMQRVEDLFRVNDSPAAVAHLVALLRRDPANYVAANRLVSALLHRNWALPAAQPMRHLDRVTYAAFSADGRQVLTASWDKSACIWDASTGHAISTFQHGNKVLSAQYGPDGTRLVTTSADGTARIWNPTNGVVFSLQHPGEVQSSEFSSDGERVLTVCAADRSARIWSVTSGVLQRELRDLNSEVVLAQFSPDGKRAASASERGSILLWDMESAKAALHLEGPPQTINALAFSPDGQILASAGDDRTARLWNTRTGERVCGPLMHNNSVTCVAFSPNGRVLLTGSQDNMVRLWSAASGQLIGQPLLHDGGVIFGSFSPDGRMVVTTSMDNTARLWDVDTGVPICQPLRHREAVLQAGFSPDGQSLVTASWDGAVQIWKIQWRFYRGLIMPHENRVTAVAFDPAGQAILSGSTDCTAHLWDARTGQSLLPPLRHLGAVQFVDYSADGHRIVTASADGTAQVWDPTTGQTVGAALRHNKPVWSAQFSPDGGLVATASADGTARIWNTETGKPLVPVLDHGEAVNMARFSRDGRLLVTASDNCSARVWNAQKGQPVTGRLHHRDRVQWAEFSPDGERVISASSDNTAQIWDVRTGNSIGPPLQHARTVQKAIFSPDGRLVVTASIDRTARIWDAQTGEALTLPLVHGESVSHACISPDGHRLLTSCWNGTSRLWDLDSGCPLTEWLDAGGLGISTCFDPAGVRMAGGTYNSSVRMLDVPPAQTPVPAWFLTFAEAVAGETLSGGGNLELVSRRELESTAAGLATMSERDFYARLARWFLADPSRRTISAF